MSDLTHRELSRAELVRLREIDRSERVSLSYRVADDQLQTVPVDWDIPTFGSDDGPDSVAAHVAFCERHLAAGACAMGVFDGDALVGIGLMTPEIRPRVAQLAHLHVSRSHRRRGVAARLVEELVQFALRSGAQQVYVSATPSESAVGFYRSRGFRLVQPLPELYELEPEDIHMIMDLPNG